MEYKDKVGHNMTEENMKNKLTLKQFSAEVGYSTRQLSRYIKSGKLFPRRWLNGRCYFLEEDIEKFNNFFQNVTNPAVLDLTLSENPDGEDELS
jgi:hypothetical protein|nr:MAG TPA: helix-turn-helix domain protein [Caudoviricetes sp.]